VPRADCPQLPPPPRDVARGRDRGGGDYLALNLYAVFLGSKSASVKPLLIFTFMYVYSSSSTGCPPASSGQWYASYRSGINSSSSMNTRAR